MTSGVVMIAVLCVSLWPVLVPRPLAAMTTPARVVGLAEVAIRAVKSGMSVAGPETDRDAWWRANVQRALVVWALAEGSALVGAALWLLTGDLAVLAGVCGAALAVLALNRPGRLLPI